MARTRSTSPGRGPKPIRSSTCAIAAASDGHPLATAGTGREAALDTAIAKMHPAAVLTPRLLNNALTLCCRLDRSAGATVKDATPAELMTRTFCTRISGYVQTPQFLALIACRRDGRSSAFCTVWHPDRDPHQERPS